MGKRDAPTPSLRSDADAEAFTAEADLSQHDLSGFKPMRFDRPEENRPEHTLAGRASKGGESQS